jgi:SAM-dependent MidA family methyltransferase
MEAALYDPHEGYYCRQGTQRWGREGDYRTSPERSALFAATFARYFVDLYRQLGEPKHWTIVEAGAGAGHFAVGVLDTLERQFPGVLAATRYVIDEVGAASVNVARERLVRFRDRVEFVSLAQMQPGYAGVVFSNELIDAFPVHRVIFQKGELQELFVTLDESGAFSWIAAPLSTPELSQYFDFVGAHLTGEGQIAEVNLDLRGWLAKVSKCFDRGYAVSVDYGDEAANLIARPERRQGTLRAFRRHQFEEALKNPGAHDITTTVDWTYMRKLGDQVELRTAGFDRLDHFLLQAGLLDQLELITDLAPTESERASLRAGAREMILPNGMAAGFHVLVQAKG